jgi:DnaJ-like protein
MTERKPPEISFTSWIDQQINEAAERGAFDNLPGAGKPLPKGETGGDAWLRNYLAREGVAAAELLPTPLKLRKERERLAETVSELRTEAEVRGVVRDLNRRIMEWRRIPTGPSIFLSLVGEEAMVSRWRQAQSAAPATPTQATPPARPRAGRREPPRPRWWHRLGRRRRPAAP